MATPTSGDTKQLLEQLVQLTDAVKQLAERPTAQRSTFDAPTDADRIRQRVAFGYQALGTLSGRVSTASGDEFDVRVVAATRRPGVIDLDGLPPGADFVELRSGGKTELLKIERDDGGVDQSATSATASRDRQDDDGLVRPRDVKDTDAIGSIVILRNRRGPLIAFGPRLGPVRGG